MIDVHGVPVEEDSQFAVWELGSEIIRRFFQGRAVGVGRGYLVGVKLGLRLSLGRAFALGRRGCGRGTRRRGRRLGLRRYKCSQRQYHD